MNTKIYASAINNLSDARYFAAMGVEFMGFEIGGPQDIERIKDIVQWVEGPIFVAEAQVGFDEQCYFEAKALGIRYVNIPPFGFDDVDYIEHKLYTFVEELPLIDDDQPIVVKIEAPYSQWSETDVEFVQTIAAFDNVYLEVFVEPKQMADFLGQIQPKGLVVKGGDEDKVGIKSYDDLEIIFDALDQF